MSEKPVIYGIVGSEAAKFTPETEAEAKRIIRMILTRPNATGYSSGHCHLGGIDIWTEEIGKELGLEGFVYPAQTRVWGTVGGYKNRNIKIVGASDEVHCITVRTLPAGYTGMKFAYCYHCHTNTHVKSGGCWTMKYAIKAGKPGILHVIEAFLETEKT